MNKSLKIIGTLVASGAFIVSSTTAVVQHEAAAEARADREAAQSTLLVREARLATVTDSLEVCQGTATIAGHLLNSNAHMTDSAEFMLDAVVASPFGAPSIDRSTAEIEKSTAEIEAGNKIIEAAGFDDLASLIEECGGTYTDDSTNSTS